MSFQDAKDHAAKSIEVANNALRSLDGKAGDEYDAARAIAIAIQEQSLALGHLAQAIEEPGSTWDQQIPPYTFD